MDTNKKKKKKCTICNGLKEIPVGAWTDETTTCAHCEGSGEEPQKGSSLLEDEGGGLFGSLTQKQYNDMDKPD